MQKVLPPAELAQPPPPKFCHPPKSDTNYSLPQFYRPGQKVTLIDPVDFRAESTKIDPVKKSTFNRPGQKIGSFR